MTTTDSSRPATATAPSPEPAGAADPDLAGPAGQRVVPRRHPARWLATAVVLVGVTQAAHGLVVNPLFQWDRFGYWFFRPVVLEGLLITLQVTALAAVFGLLGGIALAAARLSRNPVLQSVSWAYIWFFRSIPLIVLLVFLYNFSALYPELGLGIPFGPQFVSFRVTDLLGPLALAVVALTLHETAFAAEVVRGGILSVDQGQVEAAHALGLSRTRTFVRIQFPQALRSIVPSYVNLLIGLIKSSSLVFYVSLLDLFGVVQMMGSSSPGDIVPLLVVATVWYVVLTSLLSVVQYHVERFYSRGALRTRPPTPLQRLRAAVLSRRTPAGEVTR